MRLTLLPKLPKFSLRTKFLVIVLFLSALPWFGYRYFNELDSYLKQTQLHNLANTSQAIATALQQRPNLLKKLNFSRQKIQPKDFYLYSLPRSIDFTGNSDDWAQFQLPHKLFASDDTNDAQAIFRAGQFENQVFVSIDATIPNLDLNLTAQSPFTSQYIQISTTKAQEFHRYLLKLQANGKLAGYSLPDDPAVVTPITPEENISGNWTETDKGIFLEISLDKSLLGDLMAFETYFHTIHGVTSIASSPVNSPLTLGRVIEPSSDIEQIISSLQDTDSRIWVLNHAGQVLAKGGDILTSGQSWSSGVKANKLPAILEPIYDFFIGKKQPYFIDPNDQQIQFDDPITTRALHGFKGQSAQQITNSNIELLSSITPIWNQGTVIGAVLTQQTTQGIHQLRNHAMTSLINTALIVTLLAGASLLIFATSISRRITKLRDQAESVIDSHGKIQAIDINSKQADEIGDLTRSFSSMLIRVEHYNHYLENMSSRLSHELRTPITIVRSSLEHLETQETTEKQSKYLLRAQEGLQRLNNILNSMSEATRLEQTITSEKRRALNLSHLVTNCTEIYQQIYQTHQLKLQVQSDIFISGVEDYLAQLLDKIIANAVEFSQPEHSIVIQLTKGNQQAELSVTNTGPLLPKGMEQEIFNSMVSIREQENKQKTHLGLGLYISALICHYHQGKIQAFNDDKHRQVTVTASFPLATENNK